MQRKYVVLHYIKKTNKKKHLHQTKNEQKKDFKQFLKS